MNAVKLAGFVMIAAGALIAFLNRKAASLSNGDDEKKERLAWIYKIIGLGLVVAAFFMILNS